MKLWKKISLLCSLVLLIVVIVCSAILIKQAETRILDLTCSTRSKNSRHWSDPFGICSCIIMMNGTARQRHVH